MAQDDPISAVSTIVLTGGGLPAPLEVVLGPDVVTMSIKCEGSWHGEIAIPRAVFQRLQDLVPYDRVGVELLQGD